MEFCKELTSLFVGIEIYICVLDLLYTDILSLWFSAWISNYKKLLHVEEKYLRNFIFNNIFRMFLLISNFLIFSFR